MQARALQATTAALAAVLTAVAAVTAGSLTAVAAVSAVTGLTAVAAVYSSRNSSTEQPALSSILTEELYCSRSTRAVPQRRLFIVSACNRVKALAALPLRG